MALHWQFLLLLGLLMGGGKAEKFSHEYLIYLGNIQVITSAIRLFTGIEEHFPRSFEEVLNSPYFAVASKNLLNPYTGREMKAVKGPSLGDVGFLVGENEIILQTFYKQTQNGKTESSDVVLDARDKQAWIEQARTGNMISDSVEYVKSLSVEDQTTYFVCQQLSYVAYKATLNPYFSGDIQSYAGLKKDPQLFNWKVKNPYTGGIAKDVSSPSPGNFLYRVFKRGNLHFIIFLCYNRDKKPISPGMAEALQKLQKKRPSSEANSPTGKVQEALFQGVLSAQGKVRRHLSVIHHFRRN